MAREFLGTGWAFPVQTDGRGGTALREREDDIKEACRIILGTALGERVMRPDFGCAVHDLVFDPNDASLVGKVEFYVANALERWEPRIDVRRVDATVEEERMLVDAEFLVRETNRIDNFVFPFFEEGLLA